jgi:hypothetical protein
MPAMVTRRLTCIFRIYPRAAGAKEQNKSTAILS